MSHIFISHAGQQKDAAVLLREELNGLGVATWMAPDDIPTGQRWPTAITEAVRSAAAAVVLVSRRSSDSPMVKNEVGLAAKHGIPVLPVLIENVELKGDLEFYLGSLQWFPAQQGLDRAAASSLARKAQNLLFMSDSAKSEHVVDASIATASPPSDVPVDPLAFRVERRRPAYFALLLDCSHSMNRMVDGERHRRDIVAKTVNDLLGVLVDRAAQEDGTYNHYFDISVHGYGLGDGRSVEPLVGDGVVPIASVVGSERWDQSVERQTQPDGTVDEVVVERPVFIDPIANPRGHTITNTAFQTLLPLVEQWADGHPDSIPPIVLHITDGGWTPGEAPHDTITSIRELATAVGNALVFNCHVSFGGGPVLAFPSADEGENLEPRMRDLLDLSSPLPAKMIKLAQDAGYRVGREARGYVLNADATVLTDFVDIGTLGNDRGI